jgi:hypothetical protein
MLKMITSHVMLLAEVFGRNFGFVRANRPEGRGGSRLFRMLAAMALRLRQHSPPAADLSNHLRRDIGLEPVAGRSDWNW